MVQTENLFIAHWQIPSATGFLKGLFCWICEDVISDSDINSFLLTSLPIKYWIDPERFLAYFHLNIYDTSVTLCVFKDYTEMINNVIYHDRAI